MYHSHPIFPESPSLISKLLLRFAMVLMVSVWGGHKALASDDDPKGAEAGFEAPAMPHGVINPSAAIDLLEQLNQIVTPGERNLGGIWGIGAERGVSADDLARMRQGVLRLFRQIVENNQTLQAASAAATAASSEATEGMRTMRTALEAAQAQNVFLGEQVDILAKEVATLRSQLEAEKGLTQRLTDMNTASLASVDRAAELRTQQERRLEILDQEKDALLITVEQLQSRVQQLQQAEQRLQTIRQALLQVAHGSSQSSEEDDTRILEEIEDRILTLQREKTDLETLKRTQEDRIAQMQTAYDSNNHYAILMKMIFNPSVSDDEILREILRVQFHYGFTLDQLTQEWHASLWKASGIDVSSPESQTLVIKQALEEMNLPFAGEWNLIRAFTHNPMGSLRKALCDTTRPTDDVLRAYNRHRRGCAPLNTTGTAYEDCWRVLGNSFLDSGKSFGFGGGPVGTKLGNDGTTLFATSQNTLMRQALGR